MCFEGLEVLEEGGVGGGFEGGELGFEGLDFDAVLELFAFEAVLEELLLLFEFAVDVIVYLF